MKKLFVEPLLNNVFHRLETGIVEIVEDYNNLEQLLQEELKAH